MHANLAKTTDKGAKGLPRHFKRLALPLAIIPALTLLLVAFAENGVQPNAVEVYLAEQARKPVVRRQLSSDFEGRSTRLPRNSTQPS